VIAFQRPTKRDKTIPSQSHIIQFDFLQRDISLQILHNPPNRVIPERIPTQPHRCDHRIPSNQLAQHLSTVTIDPIMTQVNRTQSSVSPKRNRKCPNPVRTEKIAATNPNTAE
jgi:hypothetical protein